MLNEQQLEILADTIRPLFQYLEREVILDIARRVQNTMTYTRTAELMAMDMQRLGYAPNKIRSEVLKALRADKEYQKAVEENTIAYKKEVKKLIDEIVEQAKAMGDEIVSNAGNMSWVDDMSVWESAGKTLSDNSFLHDLQKAIAEQTIEEMVNLTRTTGFKTMSGFETVGNAYRNELDKAMIKLCTGTFSQEKVLNDVIHNLAQSGLRSIDYASGYSMQLDTAAKTALRTGCGQITAKIMDENIARTNENLVYVSRHWGARNKGIGVENHELWQGQVYFIKPGEDYSEEAKRIGQDRIMDIWYSTGYSPDGSHVNNPLGLHGYNCRHQHYVWFLGASSLPDEQPEPASVTINGKKYDYYQMTQKMRSMERNIRALKRELAARESLKLPRTEIKAKIKQKTREYEEFCRKCKVPERTTNLRVDGAAVDMTKTKAYDLYRGLTRENAIDAGEMISAKSKVRQCDTAKLIKEAIELDKPIFDDEKLGTAYRKWTTIPEDGFYDVVCHGTPETVQYFGRNISSDDLANILSGRKDYLGDNIRLLSCSTGWMDDEGNCFAQRLADTLNVDVMAPNKLLFLHDDGTIHVGSTKYKHDGEMIVFHPRKGR